MKMTELLRYDIPPEVIRLWQARESDALLPIQELAIKRHSLFGNGNLLIQAPTSSGKTFVGEMAAIQTALRRKKVVYLVPLKALGKRNTSILTRNTLLTVSRSSFRRATTASLTRNWNRGTSPSRSWSTRSSARCWCGGRNVSRKSSW